jgi:hypothetical protein
MRRCSNVTSGDKRRSPERSGEAVARAASLSYARTKIAGSMSGKGSGPAGSLLRTWGVRLIALGLVVLAASWIGVARPADSAAASRLFESPRLGYTLRTPSSWEASVRPGDEDVTVITSLRVPNRNDNPERIGLRRGGVYIWIAEYRGVPMIGIPRRAAGIQLGEKRAHACGFGEGYMLRFADHGRLIQAFIKLGPFASEGAALAVLNSLQIKTF